MKRGAKPGSVVYFVQAGGPEGYVKIGWADNFKSRRSDIQCCNPERVTTLLTVPGGQPLEKALHIALFRSRHRGEWFRCTLDLRIMVDALRVVPPENLLEFVNYVIGRQRHAYAMWVERCRAKAADLHEATYGERPVGADTPLSWPAHYGMGGRA